MRLFRAEDVQTRAASYWREAALVAAIFLPLAVILTGNPIAQNPGYHVFADTRTYLGTPNFFNVASNLAFLAVGVAGISVLQSGSGATLSWQVFFVGTALVSAGSGYYHLSPDNSTLVWDRLPMTVAFMGLFSALLREHVTEGHERTLLVLAITIGLISIAWWHYTGDLRPYVWIQLAPFLAIVILLAVFPGRYHKRSYLLSGLVFYALAKGAEFYDQEVYVLTGSWLSGHTIKHLLAALAALFVALMLRRRSAIG